MWEAITALIGLVGAIVALWQKRAKDAEKLARIETESELVASKQREKAASLELALQRKVAVFKAFFMGVEGLESELDRLFEETEIDRFMILETEIPAAGEPINPKEPPRVSAIWQRRKGSQRRFEYLHVAADQDYADRTMRTYNGGMICFNVATMEPGFMKSVYDVEGVLSSIWCRVFGYICPNTGRLYTLFCSFASHTHENLPANTQTRAGIIAGRVSQLVTAPIPGPTPHP